MANYQSIQNVNNFGSLIEYLRDELEWDFQAEDIEDLTFDYAPEELGVDKETADKIKEIRQLRPMTANQPWGIFLIDFGAQKTLITPVRQLLRGLVSKKRASDNDSDRQRFALENLLFILTSEDFGKFDFAYFRGKEGTRTSVRNGNSRRTEVRVPSAMLSIFGWQTGETHLRTLCEHNLPKLKFPSDANDKEAWLKQWREAFDVEKVTNRFFADYERVFRRVNAEAQKSIGDEEKARLFTQRLFNRLMFVYFLQKKEWLTFDGDVNYLRRLFSEAETSGENFFRERLYWVFFYGLGTNIESAELHGEPALRERRGDVPYLNGGLFEIEKDGYDERGKIELENSLFADILDVFERYNFTVEESTPMDVQVAVDPEMLGKVFEELVTGRHESGSYYTPRQIVSFMCRESLKHYLRNALSEPSASAGGLTRSFESSANVSNARLQPSATADGSDIDEIAQFVDDGSGENLTNPEKVLDALKQIRICDPACGSGAYLLGMMQELLRLRESLFTAKHLGDASLYNRKREIIENNIYGVDKDRFAVQIASLRLWLSLAIESKEPRALPNLKYKIGCGDALLAPLENDLQPDLHRRALIEQFRARKTEYSSASDYVKKSEIDTEIERLRIEIAQSLHHLPEPPKPHQIILAENETRRLKIKIQEKANDGDKYNAEKYQKDLNRLELQIEEWKRQIEPKPYTPDFFDWTVEFAEIFFADGTPTSVGAALPNKTGVLSGGFDIVLANPPYIRQELLGREYKENGLKPNFAEVYSGTADIYVYFFARANAMLERNGVGCFISSNKWLRAGYGEKLRQLLLDRTKFHLVVDFGDLPVFKATAYPSIFLWQNAERKETPTAWAEVKDLELCYQDGVRQHISEIAHILPAEQFGTGKPRIATTASASLRVQMESKGQPLKEYVKGEIYRGVLTGLNEAFVINRETRNGLIAEDKRSAEIIKPFLGGNNVRRYQIQFDENYLIWTYNGVEIEKYPAIFKHLEQFQAKAEKRWDKGNHWWELRRCAYYKVFDKPKIIYPDIGKEIRFAMDEKSYFSGNTTYLIASEDWYLLAVLNSSSIEKYFREISSEIRGGYMRFFGQYMETLPIPNASDDEREAIAKLAKETQNRHTERRGKVEQFLRDIGTSAAQSSSRNVLEKPWELSETEFVKRAKSDLLLPVFRRARDETHLLTEQTAKIEREIDERVAELYGVKAEREL